MGELVFGGLAPHPPIVVPEVGKGEAEKVSRTAQALRRLGEEIKEAGAETVLMISPHSLVFGDAVAVYREPRLEGDLAGFGAAGVRMSYENDGELVASLLREARAAGITAVPLDKEKAREYGASPGLDHGLLVPLYYLRLAGWQGRLVPVAASFLPYLDLYRFGLAIQVAIRSSGRRVGVIASGDLSHRLSPSAPAGYDPEGEVFDGAVREKLAALDVPGLLDLPPGLVERAGQCGLPSLLMLLGSLDGLGVEVEVLSYEAPFGVGYLVASLRPGQPDPQRQLLKELERFREERVKERRRQEAAPVRLAREALEAWVRRGKVLPLPEKQEEEFSRRAGCFVSLKMDGQLRGCIGTIEPTRSNLASEIIHNAIQAGGHDPRFHPVEEEELEQLTYSVDVLNPPEPAEGLRDLDPRHYGVIVESGGRRGLLLPDLEGVDSAEEQVAIARRKAGIGPGEPVRLSRFTVTRYT